MMYSSRAIRASRAFWSVTICEYSHGQPPLRKLVNLWMQISDLTNQLNEACQKVEAMQRLYEAEAAVASQSAQHCKRDSEHIARLEGRLAEALALAEAAESAKDDMQQQLHEAQVGLVTEHAVSSILMCTALQPAASVCTQSTHHIKQNATYVVLRSGCSETV